MFRKLTRALKTRIRALAAGEDFPSIFTSELPSEQTVVDLFKGDWASRLPIAGVVSGSRPDLFEDARIHWFLEHVGAGIRGASVLELGPLEGAHSAMLEKAGAGQVVAIEANGRAYLKCLAVKEMLGLQRCRFLFGDFVKHMEQSSDTYDLGIACGVFYHLRDPHLSLKAMRRRVRGAVFLWTHYWTPEIRDSYPDLWKNFNGARTVELGGGHRLELHRHEYGSTVFRKGFFGGNSHYSEWMEKQGLFRAIESAGWKVVAQRDNSNANGPAVSCILEPA